MSQEQPNVLAGYVPVIHQGYLDVINLHRTYEIRLFDETITAGVGEIRKDIRKLDADTVASALAGLGISASPIGLDKLINLFKNSSRTVTLFDDHLSHSLVQKYAKHQKNMVFESPFLMWDRRGVETATIATPDYTIANSEFVAILYNEASQSTDWWRRVATAICHNNEIIVMKHNRGMPDEYINSIEADPRAASSKGKNIEASLFIHAEADAIAEMARRGISCVGKSIYVTTFPCPNCAKLIAASGISACYYIEGYAMLDGERTLRDAGVKLIKIDVSNSELATPNAKLKKYPRT